MGGAAYLQQKFQYLHMGTSQKYWPWKYVGRDLIGALVDHNNYISAPSPQSCLLQLIIWHLPSVLGC